MDEMERYDMEEKTKDRGYKLRLDLNPESLEIGAQYFLGRVIAPHSFSSKDGKSQIPRSTRLP